MISDPHKEIEINIQGKKIPVWTYGDSGNLPIIFIHGLLRGFSDYVGDLPPRYLKDKYYVIAFDLPGIGYSKEVNLTNLEFISRIHKEILNNKKVVLFGISYGGLLSLEYAGRNNNVKAVIIAGTPVFSGIFKIYTFSRFIPYYRKRGVNKNSIREFAFLNKSNLSKIKTPVLLYYNKSDFVANPLMGRKLHEMLPDSKLFISRGLNHKWLTHRIDRSGLLSEINLFLNKITEVR